MLPPADLEHGALWLQGSILVVHRWIVPLLVDTNKRHFVTGKNTCWRSYQSYFITTDRNLHSQKKLQECPQAVARSQADTACGLPCQPRLQALRSFQQIHEAQIRCPWRDVCNHTHPKYFKIFQAPKPREMWQFQRRQGNPEERDL